MPIIEINRDPFFLTHSELHKLDLLKHFIYYDNSDFKKFNNSQIEKIEQYLLHKNSQKNRPLLFDFNDREMKYATSELLFYARLKNKSNPNIIGYNNSYQYSQYEVDLNKDYYTFPYKTKSSIFDKSGISLKDKNIEININFSSLKRVWGCFDNTVIECDKFFVAITYSKISVHHNKHSLNRFDAEFQCQGKVYFKPNRLLLGKSFKVFLDRELLYTNKHAEVYSDYEVYLSSNQKVINT